MIRGLVVLQRDGVVNYRPAGKGCISDVEALELLPGVRRGISKMNSAGFHVLVATCQPAVGRGELSARDLAKVHRRMLQLIDKAGGSVDAIFVCPHVDDAGCDCRPPEPGLLQQVVDRYPLDDGLPHYLVATDEAMVKAAREVGFQPLTIGDVIDETIPTFTDLQELAEWLIDPNRD